jgi:preprotein translocase subunit YajC
MFWPVCEVAPFCASSKLPVPVTEGMEKGMLAIWLQSSPIGGLGSLGGLALPILFFVVLYFLMILPNQRKQKKWQEMLGKVKSGDRVTTNGGIRGTVLTVKDDSLILRVQPDGVKLEFVKSAIAAVTTDEPTA